MKSVYKMKTSFHDQNKVLLLFTVIAFHMSPTEIEDLQGFPFSEQI